MVRWHARVCSGGWGGVGWGGVAFPFEGALETMLQHLWQAKRRHSFYTQDSAKLEPCGVRMNGMNYVIMSNMSTSMNALCRHVTKINHKQTQIFFVSEHAMVGSREALSS